MNTNQENIKSALVENLGEFLDSEFVKEQEKTCWISDPKPREETDLHTRMAEAAFAVYLATVEREAIER